MAKNHTRYPSAVLLFFILILLPYSSFATGTSEKIDLRQEILEVKNRLDSGKSEKIESKKLSQYLDFLKSIQTKLESPKLCHPEEAETELKISVKLKERILNAIEWVHQQRRKKTHLRMVSLKSIYELFDHVEENKRKWRAQVREDPHFKIPHFISSDRRLTCEIELMGDKKKVKISFPNNLLGEGAFKVAQEVIHYRPWKPIAELKLKNFELIPPQFSTPEEERQFKAEVEEKKRLFEKEMALSQKISDALIVPEEEESGLVKTLFVSQDKIFQENYDMALPELTEGIKGRRIRKKLTQQQRLNMIRQLANGMYLLHHQFKVVHNDVKPNNVLVRNKTEAVWSDYGLSYEPELLLNDGKSRPDGGTIAYFAPEIFKKPEWIGKDDAEKTVNATKADTFGLALIALYILEPNLYRFIINDCVPHEDPNPSKGHPWEPEIIRKYYHCRTSAITTFIENTHDRPDIHSFNHLIARSLVADPTQRLSSKQFLAGIKHIQAYPDTDPPGSASLKELKASLKSLRSYRGRIKNASTFLSGKPVGTYFLRSYLTSEKRKNQLVLCYVDEAGNPRERILKVDPKNVHQVQAQLQFLKELGTLTEVLPLNLEVSTT